MFLDVMRRLADCNLRDDDVRWLQQRNRSVLQSTLEGRLELERFRDAPLLMDGRKDSDVAGALGANTLNKRMLEQLSRRNSVPIAPLFARHGKSDTEDGRKMTEGDLQEMDSAEFRSMENVLYVCVGPRVLLTQKCGQRVAGRTL